MKIHPVLGPTYQVKILETGEEARTDFIREQMLKLMQGRARSSTEPNNDGDEEEVGSQSSSTSEASSSMTEESEKRGNKRKGHEKNKKKHMSKKEQKHSGKGKKNRAKDKGKHKKAKECKAAAEYAKQEKARISKVHSQCGRVTARLLPTVLQVRQLLKDANMSQLPTTMKAKMEQHLKTLQEYETEAKIKMRLKDPLDLAFAVEDVVMACKEAVTDVKLCQSMLQSYMKT